MFKNVSFKPELNLFQATKRLECSQHILLGFRGFFYAKK